MYKQDRRHIYGESKINLLVFTNGNEVLKVVKV